MKAQPITSNPCWSSAVPTEPGRYFYRDNKSGDYGMCLVAWDRGLVHGDYVRQPSLGIRAQCIMGYGPPLDWHDQGENSGHPGWSYGTGDTSDSRVFWTEPVATPPDFPSLTGRPADVAPALIKKEKAKSKARSKESKKRQREQAKARKAAIAAASTDGVDLYQCEGCESLLRSEDRVVGKLRECPHCCTEFVESDDGRSCPDCNRPFTRLSDEKKTCADCRDGGELPDLTLLVKAGVVTETS